MQEEVDFNDVLQAYLDEKINLGRAARLLGVSRFELMARFTERGIPLRIGPSSLEEAQDEIEVARRHRPKD
jgi:predicted HTH domain antitoxin